jgi:hypothetical protein
VTDLTYLRHYAFLIASTHITARSPTDSTNQGKRVFIKDITHYLVPPNKKPASVAPSLHIPKRGVGTNGTNGTNGAPKGVTHKDSGIVMQDSKSAQYPYSTPSEPGNPSVMPRELLEKFHFTFLIRHPRNSIPSYYRCCVPPLVEKTGFNEFMPEESGYDELRRFFDYCKDTGIVGPKICGQEDNGAVAKPNSVEICVMDADDLLDDPEGMLRHYCASVGIEFDQGMLNWDTEEEHQAAKDAFEKWNGFHEDAIHSKDLKPRATVSIIHSVVSVNFPSAANNIAEEDPQVRREALRRVEGDLWRKGRRCHPRHRCRQRRRLRVLEAVCYQGDSRLKMLSRLS